MIPKKHLRLIDLENQIIKTIDCFESCLCNKKSDHDKTQLLV